MSPTPLTVRLPGRGWATLVSLLILFALAVWLGLSPLSAVPDVVPASADPTLFSAERAMAHLNIIAATPRPIGSAANAATRDYLMAQIAALGLQPEVQATHVLRTEPGFPEAHIVAVENVLVRVPGSEPGGQALLVSGHYDSVATSSGASDCGTCSATTLETLRAVVATADAGRPLRNDVIFLFTDAEENGVVGATGFMRDHPWADDVGLAIVFEALGSGGAPLLYVSSRGSGEATAAALDVLRESTRYPLASSFLHDFMWNVAGNTGSDLDAFAEGAPGFGFIYLPLETVASYHNQADNLAALDPRSLQGMGDLALALTRAFGDRPLDDLAGAPDRVIFPLAPGVVVDYSSRLAVPLAVVATALLAAALALGLRRGRLTGRGLLAAFALGVPLMLTAVLAVTGVWWLVRLLTPGLHTFTVGGWWGNGFYLAASLVLALAVALAWRGMLRFQAADLLAGGLLWFAFLAFVMSLILPGISYLFVWPLLVVALGWVVLAVRPGGQWSALPVVAGAFVALVLAAPVAYWLWIYVGRAEGQMGIPFAALPVLFVLPALLLAVAAADSLPATTAPAAPQGTSLLVPRRSWLALLVLAVALFAIPALRRPTPARPWVNTVVYTLDAGQGTAHWVTFNDSRAGRGTRQQLDAWTRQFFAGGVEEMTFDPWLVTRSDAPYPALRAVAPLVALPNTTITAVYAGGEAQLTLSRPPQAMLTRLVVRATVPITAVTLDGQPLDLAGTQPTEYTILVLGRADTVTLALGGPDEGDMTIEVLDRLTNDVMAIAAQAGLTINPRPAWMGVASASDTGEGAIVTTQFP